MTTSIHLLVSDDSVAHTALMYSEESGETHWWKGTRPIWLQGLPWWIMLQWTSLLYQRMLSHLTGVINQNRTLLLMQKVTANHWKTHETKYFFHSVDEMRPQHDGVMFISFVYNIFGNVGRVWLVCNKGRKKTKQTRHISFKRRTEWKRKLETEKAHRFVLTEIPALPQAFLSFCADFSTGHKQWSYTCRTGGRGGGEGGKKNWENEINICLKIASQHGKERFEDIILKGCCEWGREKGRLSTVKYERHILPDSLWLFLILPTPAHWSDP